MSLSAPYRDVYRRLTDATREYFGAEASYVRSYVDDGSLERLDSRLGMAEAGGRLASAFNLRSGELLISDDAARLIEDFMAGRFTSSDPARRRWEMQQLRRVRGALDSLIHENVHALGPRERADMRAEWESTRYPHVPAASEGFAELAAQRSGGDILRLAGLGDVDPRIMVVSAVDHDLVFPGSASAAREFVRLIADFTGGTENAELAAIIRDGGAKLAIDNAVRRVIEAQGLANLPQGRGVVAFIRLTRQVEDAFSSVSELPISERDPGFRRQFGRQRIVTLRRDITRTLGELRGNSGPSQIAL